MQGILENRLVKPVSDFIDPPDPLADIAEAFNQNEAHKSQL